MLTRTVQVVLALTCLCGSTAKAQSQDQSHSTVEEIEQFLSNLSASEGGRVDINLGEKIFYSLAQTYRDDAGFGAFRSKLAAAEVLSRQMVGQLKRATDTQILSTADEVFSTNVAARPTGEKPVVAPAASFYRSSLNIFGRPITIGDLKPREKAFLAAYYHVRLRSYVGDISMAGQALAIAEPSFEGTHDYVLVLPLLHALGEDPVKTSILPVWMTQPSQLDRFSDSCLLHFGFPSHAMTFAEKSALRRDKEFSAETYYRQAAKKCGTKFAHTGAECLKLAYDTLKAPQPDKRISLLLEIVQTWLDSKNYRLAAGQAREIFEVFPEHSSTDKAVWLYHYALSRAGNTKEILLHIDEALADPKCADYSTNLLYIKWWALRRTPGEEGRVLAVEHQLISQSGDSPIVAPIMLSRATDSLAKQDYAGAYSLLRDLVDRFPSSTAAKQAEKMMDKLGNIAPK